MSDIPTPLVDAESTTLVKLTTEAQRNNVSWFEAFVKADAARILERRIHSIADQRDKAERELLTVTAERDRLKEATKVLQLGLMKCSFASMRTPDETAAFAVAAMNDAQPLLTT